MSNAKFFKWHCHRTFPRTPSGRKSSQDEVIVRAKSSAEAPYQIRLLQLTQTRRHNRITSSQVTHRMAKLELGAIIFNLQVVLVLCSIWSAGLVWSVDASNKLTEEESHQPFSDIITFHQALHSTKNDSSTNWPSLSSSQANSRSHRVRRLSIWRNPLSDSKFRQRLFAIGRPLSTSSRDSKPSGAYSRLSQFVRNRLHNLNLAINSKLYHKGRSVDDGPQLTSTNDTNVAVDNNTDLASDQEERLTRRHDDTWLNQVEIDVSLNSSTKDAHNNAPYLSPTLNVIDLEPYNTKIAHNILVVRKSGNASNDSNNTATHNNDLSPIKLPTPAPVVVSSEVKNFSPNRNSATSAVPSTTNKPSRDDSFLEFVPIKNNHRPSTFMSLAKWKLKNKDKLITSTSTTQAKFELDTNTPTSTSSKAPWQDQQVASSRLTISPAVSVITTIMTTRKPTYSPKPAPVSTLHSSSSTTLPPHTEWASSTLFSSSKSSPLSTAHTLATGQSELVADLTTREQWSTVSALSQDDFWSSYATENPMTTMFTTGSVTEFDLPITRPSTDANESTQSWEKTHNSAQLTNGWKETAWSELITSKPLDATSTSVRSTTAKAWTGPTSGKEDDNSIEMMKEYQHKQTWPTNTSTSTHSTPIEDKGANKVNFYLDNGQQHNTQQNPMEDAVVIFKNNHGRPRRPISASRPSSTTNKHMITAKPPYVTDFHYPTTISVKKPTITVANIVAHRVKQPDEVQSASLTVLDPPFVPDSFMQLPLNTTIVHKNILVPMKEGRPKPSYPSRPTTHFPVYPVVAGVSNWQAQTTPWILPVMTTSSPDKLEGLIPSSSTSNFSFGSTDDEFKWFTTTTAPSKTISKVISVFPIKSHTKPSSIDRVGTSKPKTTTTTPPPPVLSSTQRPASYPVVSSSGNYVNAIYAPPMPLMRPAHSLESGQAVASWLRPLSKLFNLIAPNQGSVSFLSVVRSVLYSLMVMLLPPLALMSAFSLI